MYRVIDKENNKLGVPIKASSVFSKPTLSKLQVRFEINIKSRDVLKNKIKEIIDAAIAKKTSDLPQLIHALACHKIDTLVRKNNEGKVFGITFIDNANKSVFNGSEIGKKYSIMGLQNQFITANLSAKLKEEDAAFVQSSSSASKQNKAVVKQLSKPPGQTKLINILDDLLSKEHIENIPSAFKRKRKKKKKNNEL